MSNLHNIIKLLFSTALFINAILFIAQLIKIIREKSSECVSILTFSSLLLIQLAVVLYGIITENYLLTAGYILNTFICGLVVLFALIYKKNVSKKINTELTLEEIIEQLPGHVYWKDINGSTLGCNSNSWKNLGMKSPYDLIGKTDYELYPKEEAEQLRINDLEVLNTGQLKIAEEKVKKLDGDTIMYLSHKVPLYSRQGKLVGILGVSLDVTEERQKQLERLEFLEDIIALMPGHVYWVNRDNVYLGCNDNQAKSAGIPSRKDIIGKRNKDLPWNASTSILSESLDKANNQVMESGLPLILEEPGIAPDGSELLFLSNKAPIRNKEGNILGMVGISIDITELKQTQRTLQETQQKLEGMTLLLGSSIAHELRTPLATIKISNENLKNVFPNLIEAYRIAKKANISIPIIRDYYLKVTETAFNVISSEIDSTNNFIDMLLVNVNTAINNNLPQTEQFLVSKCISKALLRYPFKEHQRKLINVNQEIDFLVKANQELIEHVLFNLIKNALYYIAAASKDNAHIEIWVEKSTAFNKLYFKDTGTGIEPDILPHIFEQFFSRTHHGAGIGLTFCKMVMESLGGSISCESEKGNYTQFILLFPSTNN